MKNNHTVREGFDEWPAPPSDLAGFLDDVRREPRPKRGIRSLLATLLGALPGRG